MNNKRSWIFTVLTLLLFSCGNFQATTRENAMGRYVNRYEEGANHYVELFPTGEFLHYYSGREGEFENRGRWEYLKREDEVEISFEKWRSYGRYKSKGCINGCLYFVRLKNYELIFDSDMPFEMNFKKVNEQRARAAE